MARPKKEDETRELGNWKPYDDSLRDRVIIVTDTLESEGEAVYFRKARKYNRELRRYEDVSYWATLLTNAPLSFTPKYWKER